MGHNFRPAVDYISRLRPGVEHSRIIDIAAVEAAYTGNVIDANLEKMMTKYGVNLGIYEISAGNVVLYSIACSPQVSRMRSTPGLHVCKNPLSSSRGGRQPPAPCISGIEYTATDS